MGMLTVRETARVLGVHENTVRRWAVRGLLRPARLPGSGFRRFDTDEVLALARRMNAGRAGAASVTHEPSRLREMAPGTRSGAGNDGADLRQSSIYYWMERARAQGFHVPLDVYDAGTTARPEEAPAELPAPWSEHFRPLTLEEVLHLVEEDG